WEGVAVVHRHDLSGPGAVHSFQSAVASVEALAGGVLFIAPPESGAAARPAGPLPLRLGRQAIAHAIGLHPGAILQPTPEGGDVIEADVDDGVIVSQGEWPRETGLAPGDAGLVLPHGQDVMGVSTAALFAIAAMPRCLHEATELADCRFVLAQVERA